MNSEVRNKKLNFRTWCATEVNGTGHMIPEKWGYCTKKCGYCAGSPVGVRTYRPCGYDCLLNPFKVEVIALHLQFWLQCPTGVLGERILAVCSCICMCMSVYDY